MVWPLMLYLLFGIPVAVAAIIFINVRDVSTPGSTQRRACAITIILHLVATITPAAGFLVWALFGGIMK